MSADDSASPSIGPLERAFAQMDARQDHVRDRYAELKRTKLLKRALLTEIRCSIGAGCVLAQFIPVPWGTGIFLPEYKLAPQPLLDRSVPEARARLLDSRGRWPDRFELLDAMRPEQVFLMTCAHVMDVPLIVGQIRLGEQGRPLRLRMG